MPITQDRLMTVVTGAAKIIEAFKEIRYLDRAYAEVAISKANALLDREEDEGTINTITDLVAIINRIHAAIERSDVITSDLTTAILIEQQHFKRTAKANEKAAKIQELRRRKLGLKPRQKHDESPIKATELIKPIKSDEAINVDPDTSNENTDLHFALWKEAQGKEKLTIEERTRRRQEAIAKGETVPDEFVIDKPPSIFPPDADIRPLTDEEVRAAQKQEQETKLKGVKQKDGTIIEMPSNDEMNNIGTIKPGESVL
jgi:hypothetical protein